MAEPEAEAGGAAPLGEYLKSVRISRGLELDEASRVTKIGKNYLIAMEQGEFQKLPSAAYIKGFLRLYADFLSLSGDEVVARYEQSLQSAPRPQAEAGVPRTPQVEKGKAVAGPGRWVVPGFLLVLVIMAAIFFGESDERPPRPAVKPAAPPPAAPQPAPQPQNPAVLSPHSSAQQAIPPAAPTAPAPAATPAPAPAPAPAAAPPPAQKQPGGIVLRLRFNRDSWLAITIDDSISQRYDLKAGDVIEWKGTRSFVIDLGDGGAVDAEYNGRHLKLGEAGKPVHVELKGA
ncbi:RodZ domain-containing protein [Geomonas sp. Red32]|uniref:helix-turn-helix domain-containing protein n=1 Tax=Geomonas sp. Red32 TaxID=2912856 RepID=UPI003312FAEB